MESTNINAIRQYNSPQKNKMETIQHGDKLLEGTFTHHHWLQSGYQNEARNCQETLVNITCSMNVINTP
jgi:hypothetical protein